MLQREIEPGQAADIEKFERVLAGYLAGEVDEDVFRVFRLTNGIYGQRQGGHNQMVRVRIPYGGVTAEQLDMFAHIAPFAWHGKRHNVFCVDYSVGARWSARRAGRAPELEEEFFAISVERRITHPCVAAITRAARGHFLKVG